MKEADTFEVDSFSNSLLVIPKYLYRLQSLTFSQASVLYTIVFPPNVFHDTLVSRVKLSRS